MKGYSVDSLTLEDWAEGKGLVPCPQCGGHGTDHVGVAGMFRVETCSLCDGEKYLEPDDLRLEVITPAILEAYTMDCGECDGEGEVYAMVDGEMTDCEDCDGSGGVTFSDER